MGPTVEADLRRRPAPICHLGARNGDLGGRCPNQARRLQNSSRACCRASGLAGARPKYRGLAGAVGSLDRWSPGFERRHLDGDRRRRRLPLIPTHESAAKSAPAKTISQVKALSRFPRCRNSAAGPSGLVETCTIKLEWHAPATSPGAPLQLCWRIDYSRKDNDEFQAGVLWLDAGTGEQVDAAATM